VEKIHAICSVGWKKNAVFGGLGGKLKFAKTVDYQGLEGCFCLLGWKTFFRKIY